MTAPPDPVATFASAATSFATLVHEIGSDRWDGSGLGEWNLRALVGHTSRSLITVRSYLDTSAERADITTPQEYYVLVSGPALGLDPAAIVERGRQAGRDLGPDPAEAVDALVEQVVPEVNAAGDRLIEVIGGKGIWLHTYLVTRTFELAVHGLDVARATGITFTLSDPVLEEATVLATRIAAATGRAETVLVSLTGRGRLPPSFSVV